MIILEVSTQSGLTKDEAIKQEMYTEWDLEKVDLVTYNFGDYMLRNHIKYCLFCTEDGQPLTQKQLKDIIESEVEKQKESGKRFIGEIL